MSFIIETVDMPSDDHLDVIRKPPVPYNKRHACKVTNADLASPLRDASSEVGGGLSAKTVYDRMFLKRLVVSEFLRSQGARANLLRQAATATSASGRVGLDTFSLQPRHFSENQGYHPFGTLPAHA